MEFQDISIIAKKNEPQNTSIITVNKIIPQEKEKGPTHGKKQTDGGLAFFITENFNNNQTVNKV